VNPAAREATADDALIEVRDLTMAFGGFAVQRDLAFEIRRGAVFVIMGDSGSGKSTLLRHMIGLARPAKGDVCYHGEPFWAASPERREEIKGSFGVLFQSGALWSSLTLAENIALPLDQYARLARAERDELVEFKLALVGLAGFGGYYPAEISGGMRKRAGLARAIALDPEILFFDEPSAGLDPLSSRRLDELILELSESLRATVIVVTHELESIFSIATDSVFLDAESRTQIALGAPQWLREHAEHPKVRSFLARGAT
jgi:phospholipid/cholesterol/gamma-HCH transport system ATP-binding protein